MPTPDRAHEPAVLTSWKEVAAYLGKGVRTVQRWEKYDSLPVRRLAGTSKIVVHRDDLDRWLRAQPSTNHIAPAASGPASPRNFQRSSELRPQPSDLSLPIAPPFQPPISQFHSLNSLCDDLPLNPIHGRTRHRNISKGELQSDNEELRAVNAAMQHRNEQLSQLNHDLTNLVNGINLPLVIVDSDLTVRSFTPQAAHVLGLVSSAIGRPIPCLKLKIEVETLQQAMLEVLHHGHPKHHRVKDSEGAWRSFRLAPHPALDNRIDGVVLSIITSDSPQN